MLVLLLFSFVVKSSSSVANIGFYAFKKNKITSPILHDLFINRYLLLQSNTVFTLLWRIKYKLMVCTFTDHLKYNQLRR